METRTASLNQSSHYDSFFFAKKHTPAQTIDDKVNDEQVKNVQKLRGFLIELKDLCEKVLAKQYKKIFTKELLTERDLFIQNKYYEFEEFTNVIKRLIDKPSREHINQHLEVFRTIKSHQFIYVQFINYSSYNFYHKNSTEHTLDKLDKLDKKTRKTIEFVMDFITYNISGFPNYKSATYPYAKKKQPIIPKKDFEETYLTHDWTPNYFYQPNYYSHTYYPHVEERNEQENKSGVSSYLNKIVNWNPFKKNKSHEVEPSDFNCANKKRIFPLY